MKTNECNEENSRPIIKYVVNGGQVNINNGNGVINANQGNANNKVIKKIIIENTYIQRQSSSEKTNNDANASSIILALIVLVAMSKYIEYRYQIRGIFCLIAVIIEIMTCYIFYTSKKNKILCDDNIKKIIFFNFISVLIILAMMGIISSRLYDNVFKFSDLERQIENHGLIFGYANSKEGIYVLLQMAGVLFSGMFLLFSVISSNLYVVAVLSIAMEKRCKGFWKWLLKITCGKSKDGNKYIKNGLIWLSISILFTSGILAYIMSFMQQSSTNIGF